ncbi:DUF4910 domain-containing protein [bacterium]|nr:DUF4910 domain-containing protein [bacterium]
MDLKNSLETYFDRLWPLCRSLTGEGYRRSLDILSEVMPMERLKFESGRRVLDWIVPKEWIARDAYLIDPNGVKRADFKSNNLHLVGYSIPFNGTLNLSDLRPHLHSIPAQPDAIPYVISYYTEAWGLCMTHRELQSLPEGDYQVVVDTELTDGHVEVGEAVLPGSTDREIFFSTNLCHPSLANNELSGPLVMAFLYDRIASLPNRRFSYRFVVAPETIGAVCYLSVRGDHLKQRMDAGFQMTCIGDRGHFTYKLSRRGDTLADRAARLVLRDMGPHEIIPFDPLGSDERQYCSPGFDLPFGSLMRTRYMRYPEYHTSLDNKDFISFEAMTGSIDAYFGMVCALENNVRWRGTVLDGEPQMGRRGLYITNGTPQGKQDRDRAKFWVLNLADGANDLMHIAERSGQPLKTLISVSAELRTAGLLREE